MSQRKEIRETYPVSEEFEYSFIQGFVEEFDEQTAEKVDEFYSEDQIVPVQGTEEEKYRRARTRLPEIWPERFLEDRYENEEIDKLYSVARLTEEYPASKTIDRKLHTKVNRDTFEEADTAVIWHDVIEVALTEGRFLRDVDGEKDVFDASQVYGLLDCMRDRELDIAIPRDSWKTFRAYDESKVFKQRFYGAFEDVEVSEEYGLLSHDLEGLENTVVLTGESAYRLEDREAETERVAPDIAYMGFSSL